MRVAGDAWGRARLLMPPRMSAARAPGPGPRGWGSRGAASRAAAPAPAARYDQNEVSVSGCLPCVAICF